VVAPVGQPQTPQPLLTGMGVSTLNPEPCTQCRRAGAADKRALPNARPPVQPLPPPLRPPPLPTTALRPRRLLPPTQPRPPRARPSDGGTRAVGQRATGHRRISQEARGSARGASSKTAHAPCALDGTPWSAHARPGCPSLAVPSCDVAPAVSREDSQPVVSRKGS